MRNYPNDRMTALPDCSLLRWAVVVGRGTYGVAIPVARAAGIALIALGITCWPGPPLAGMLTYSAVATLYLAYLGLAGGFTGTFYGPRLRFT